MNALRSFLFVLTALVAYSCSCDNESLTKKAAKFVTKQAIEAGKGVNEAIKEDSGKIALSTAESAGELLSGAAEGANNVASEKGQEIGKNLGGATGKFLSGFGQGLEDNLSDFSWKVSPDNSSDLQVFGATKTLVQATKVNLYIRFLTGGKHNIRLDAYDKSCSTLIGSVTTRVDAAALEFKAVDFVFGNPEPVRLGECMVVKLVK